MRTAVAQLQSVRFDNAGLLDRNFHKALFYVLGHLLSSGSAHEELRASVHDINTADLDVNHQN